MYVYNPLSVLYCLHKQNLLTTGLKLAHHAFLISLLKKHYDKLEDFKDVELTSISLGPFEIGEEPLIPILFQAGYLTIAHHRRVNENSQIIDLYTLRYPNLEVAEAFKKFMLAALARTSYQEINTLISKFISALKRHDIQHFVPLYQPYLPIYPTNCIFRRRNIIIRSFSKFALS